MKCRTVSKFYEKIALLFCRTVTFQVLKTSDKLIFNQSVEIHERDSTVICDNFPDDS